MAASVEKKSTQKKTSPSLSEKSVQEIRSLYARSNAGWTAKSLARIFDTTETAITAVLNRTGAYKEIP